MSEQQKKNADVLLNSHKDIGSAVNIQNIKDMEVGSHRVMMANVYITIGNNKLTPWLMEPVGSMLHSQGISNNSYPEPNQPNSPH